MPDRPFLINGGMHSDKRGRIRFVNDFSMNEVRRFYSISPSEEQPVRAWQGHQKEKKFFYCQRGAFTVIVIPLDQCEGDADEMDIFTFNLSENDSNLLVIPAGFVNGFKALKKNSELLVFSDCALGESLNDDFRYDESKWIDWKTI